VDCITVGPNNAIAEASLSTFISVSPNPAAGSVHISTSGLKIISSQLIDVAGRKHLLRCSGEAGEYSADVSGFVPGFYFLVLNTPGGTTLTRLAIR
jgi:hypothetical protein